MQRKTPTKLPSRSVSGNVGSNRKRSSAGTNIKSSDGAGFLVKASDRAGVRQNKSATRRKSSSKVYEPDRRASFVIGVLGNQRVSNLLAVSKSQPGRWKSGSEVPSPVAARRLVDVDYVLARFLLLCDKSLAAEWLSAPNGFLDGATPFEVIMTKGSQEVIEALEAEASGAFA